MISVPFYVWEDVRVWTFEVIPLILKYLGPVSSFSLSWIPLQANHPGAAAVAYGLIAGNVLLSIVVLLKSQNTSFLITLPENWQKLFLCDIEIMFSEPFFLCLYLLAVAIFILSAHQSEGFSFTGDKSMYWMDYLDYSKLPWKKKSL